MDIVKTNFIGLNLFIDYKIIFFIGSRFSFIENYL